MVYNSSMFESICIGRQTDRQTDKLQPILTESSVSEVLRKAPRGSSCGPSGWRYVRFKFMQDNHSTFDFLHSVYALIADGNVPPNIIPLLSAS